MHRHAPKLSLALLFLNVLPFAGSALRAQTAAATPASPADDSTVQRLDPFDVHASRNVGYGAQNSTSSSRLNLQYIDVPQTVSVVTAEFLKDSNLTDSRWFTEFEPDIITRTNAHQLETFYIRGLQTSLSFVDGFQVSKAQDRDAAIYDRIEYVKGPASAAIGRGEAAGLINYIEKQPLLHNVTNLDLTVGDYNFYRGVVDTNFTLGKAGDKAARVVAYYHTSDDPRGGSLSHTNKVGVAPSFLWNLSSSTKLTVNGDFFKHDMPGTVGTADWTDPTIYAEFIRSGVLPASAKWKPGPTTPFLSPRRLIGFKGDYNDSDVAELTAILTHDFGHGLNYRQGVRLDREIQEAHLNDTGTALNPDPADATQWLVPVVITQNYNRNSEGRTQGDLLYSADWANTKQTLLGGWELADSWASVKTMQTGNLVQNMYTPNYDLPAGFSYANAPTTASSYASSAVYGYYGQYMGSFFGDRLTAIVGIRYDHSRTVTHNRISNGVTYSGWVGTHAPRYSLGYKPLPWMSIYGLHSEQSDAPVTQNKYSNFLASGGATVPTAGSPLLATPVSGQAVTKMDEAGLKMQFLDKRVSVSLALFRLQRDGVLQFQFASTTGTNGLGTLAYNSYYSGPGERIKGGEIEAFGVITNRLTFRASYARETGDTGYPNFVRGPLSLLIPEAAANLKYDWRDQNHQGWVATAGANAFFKGWAIQNSIGSLTYPKNQYVANLGVSYYFKRGRSSVRLSVNNITDEFALISTNSQVPLRRAFLEFDQQF